MLGKFAGHCEDPRQQVAGALPFSLPPRHSKSHPIGPACLTHTSISFASQGINHPPLKGSSSASVLCVYIEVMLEFVARFAVHNVLG